MEVRVVNACAAGNLLLLLSLADGSPNILNGAEPSTGCNLMHVATKPQQVEIVSFLLANKHKLVQRACGVQGLTLLHLAATSGAVNMMRLFLDQAPEAMVQVTNLGETILHLMARNKDLVKNRIMQLINFILKEKAVRVNVRDHAGKTVLDIAIEKHCHPESEQMVVCFREAHCITGGEYRSWSSRHEASDKQLHGVLNTAVVTGVLIASLAFSTLLNPPGGVHKDGPLAGKAILRTHPFFPALFTFNVVALLTSLVIVFIQSISVVRPAHPSVGCLHITLLTLSTTCILMNHVTAVWMICFSESKRTALVVTLRIVLGAFTADRSKLSLTEAENQEGAQHDQLFMWTVEKVKGSGPL